MEIREQAKIIAYELQGTCEGNVEDKIEEHGFADVIDLYYAIDDLVFCCVRCNWWCVISEAHEINDEFWCTQCSEEEY